MFILKFIIGLLLGIGGTLFIWLIIGSASISPLIKDTPTTRKCMTQQVYVFNPKREGISASINIGETVICAKDWQISEIYGPDAEAFYGRIKLRDWDLNEFTIK